MLHVLSVWRGHFMPDKRLGHRGRVPVPQVLSEVV